MHYYPPKAQPFLPYMKEQSTTRIILLGTALAVGLLCSGCGKPSRLQMVEATSLENQNGLQEMQHRVAALENRVESLAVDVREQGARSYEVRNRAGRKTGMTIHPVAAVLPVAPASASNKAAALAPASLASASSAQRTAPPRTMADVEKEDGKPAKGNSSPALSLPPTGAVTAEPATAPAVASMPGLPPATATPVGQATVKATKPEKAAKPVTTAAPAPQPPADATVALALPPEGSIQPTATATAAPAAPSKAARGKALPSAAKGEEGAYKAALQLVTSGKAAQGREQFQAFLQNYPAGRYAANAHYWIGESYYFQRNYTEALLAFKQVSTQFPRHHKTADALLKAGMTYQKLGDKENAQLQFKALQSDFPQSEAAQRIRGRSGR